MKFQLPVIFCLIIQFGILINLNARDNKEIGDTIPPNNKVSVADSFSFARADKEAEYPGEKGAWRSFLQNEIDQSVAVRKGAPVGTYVVYVQFIIMPDGKVGEVKALSRNGFGMEEELVRVIKRSKSWLPAIENGRAVKAYRKQPITFTVFEDVSEKKRKNWFWGW